jgi:hypothetical protein
MSILAGPGLLGCDHKFAQIPRGAGIDFALYRNDVHVDSHAMNAA